MFAIKEILEYTKGTLISGDEKIITKAISTDTRTISRKSFYIALRGKTFNGHEFLDVAFKNGAIGVIVSKNEFAKKKFNNILREKGAIITVDNTTKALGDIAVLHRSRVKALVVAITGSNGKTTTKDMIACVLSKRNKTLKTCSTENNQIGVPLTLLRIKNEPYAVIELGTSTLGEIDYLARIIRPDIALITNIGPSHLEGLKTVKDILKEKSTLFKYLKKGGYAIINNDDPLLSTLKIIGKKITFGIKHKKCDYYADDIMFNNYGTSFVINKKHRFSIPVFGTHNVYNALATVCVCAALGLDMKFIQRAFSDFKPADMRFNISSLDGISLINDAYNSNPLSMKAAVETICALDSNGRKIVVAADMLELGKSADILHYETGKMIAIHNIDMLITVGKLSANMAKGAKDAGMTKENIKNFKDRQEAADYLLNIKKKGDTILIKGSRAMKMEEIVKCFTTCYIR